jgi:hypothetical protein
MSISQHAAGGRCLSHALVGQVDIGPAGEAVFQVPGGFAMAHEYDFVHKLFFKKVCEKFPILLLFYNARIHFNHWTLCEIHY